VEHACHRCGTAVEDGIVFCGKCGAPQIRVVGVLDDSASDASVVSDASLGNTAPAVVNFQRFGQVRWSRGLRAAALAAVSAGITGILVAVAVRVPQIIFLVWMLGGGLLAVVIYQAGKNGERVTAGIGARLGAAAGLIGFVIFATLSGLELIASRGSEELRNALREQLQQSAMRSGDPHAMELVQRFMTPEGTVVLVVVGMVLMLAAFLLLSSIGGMIGAMLFGNKKSY